MNSSDLRTLILKNTPFIDVRAPVEFMMGHLPGAINLPILSDKERTLVGTTYKELGNQAAVKLGFELVSGKVKEARVNLWLDFIKKNPSAVLYCFRGGLRSQITQSWLREAGVDLPIISGGYKSARNFLLEEIKRFATDYSYLVISGTTGSGKTRFLNSMSSLYPIIDLEQLALHRGSAFGSLDIPQPSQANFENQLAVLQIKFHMTNKKPILIEDESSAIGKCGIPKILFDKMQASQILWLDEPLEQRVQNIFEDYIVNPLKSKNPVESLEVFARYKGSIRTISKKLGGQRSQELLGILENCEREFIDSKALKQNIDWIEKLLVYYYDPMYLNSLTRRQAQIVFKGDSLACAEYLKNY